MWLYVWVDSCTDRQTEFVNKIILCSKVLKIRNFCNFDSILVPADIQTQWLECKKRNPLEFVRIVCKDSKVDYIESLKRLCNHKRLPKVLGFETILTKKVSLKLAPKN